MLETMLAYLPVVFSLSKTRYSIITIIKHAHGNKNTNNILLSFTTSSEKYFIVNTSSFLSFIIISHYNFYCVLLVVPDCFPPLVTF